MPGSGCAVRGPSISGDGDERRLATAMSGSNYSSMAHTTANGVSTPTSPTASGGKSSNA
ncbi:hypothetical protein Tcan_13491 [Toxocara canis]|uniref:Uncharacterized protein n=1 Tax=Toxocara canis TaxID=6265 RepID=A0A0B2VP27_TOXCA|nr:hypothetical protein Tcan_13491 [Toxocara canis]